jgi:hypothetical protein
MAGRLRGRRVAAIAGAALVLAPGAWAHGGTRSTGYISTFSNLEPNVVGVSVNIFGRDNTISLSNYSGKTVVVLGRSGEPYLRFVPGRVEENMRSPTTARPRWRKVANGASYAWHDHRIVWSRTSPPRIVRQAPDVSHLVFRWALHATADGKPFLIKGFLGWAPSPTKNGGDTSAWVFAAAAGGAGAAVAAALALGLRARRARRRAL